MQLYWQITDFGVFENCDRITFNRCEDRIIIAGSKSWELEEINKIFEMAEKKSIEKKTLLEYIFCFNFTAEADYEGIRKGMAEIKNVHFLSYTVDPFSSSAFTDADSIFAEILPEKVEEKKDGFVARLFKREKKEKKYGKNVNHGV